MSKTHHHRRKPVAERPEEGPVSKKPNDNLRKDKKLRNALRSNNVDALLHLEEDDA